MKNKINKKTLLFIIITTFISVIFFAFILKYQYKNYTKNYNESINSIIYEVTLKYPDISKDDLIEIMNNNKKSVDVLSKYGINDENSSIILNDKLFKKYFFIDLLILVVIILIIYLFFIINKSKRNKKINKIIELISSINRRNFDIDIEEYTEDELSGLKQEIYKTSLMLRSEADNQLKDKLNLKDSLSDISHQLKTPLTSITIMIDNILDNDDMDTKTRRKFLINIKREIININFLVQNLLKLSKFDANVIKFNKENVLIKNIVDEAIKKVSALSELKGISIKVSGDKNATINCDFMWEVEAISNIIKNSIEHIGNDGFVEINYTKNKAYSRILIRDNGVGIDSEDLPHIFDRFYKGKNTGRDSVGIGLALSKSIIEKDNGSISVKSTPNIGTIFTIKFFG
ncbi:MAG: HAMP domain-containing sensor histidine kinase [Bacilli bacterium]|nr:HAMP domain-containing sensor histidine kinase [Bacilli bacterium]